MMRRIGLVALVCCGFVALLYGQRLVRLDGEGAGRSYGGGLPRLSPNGQVVLTDIRSAITDKPHPAMWTVRDRWWYLKRDGGLTRDPREAIWGYARDVSYDGSVVLGNELYGNPRDPSLRPFRWRRGVGIEYLPFPPGTYRAVGLKVSWDGEWVAGAAAFWRGGYEERWTVRWSPTGQTELINLMGRVQDFSASGREILDACNYFQSAFWRAGWGTRCSLPFSNFGGLSGDGRVAIGVGVHPEWSGLARWFPDEDRYEPVPANMRFSPFKHRVSFDGRVMLLGGSEYDRDWNFVRDLVLFWEEGRGWSDLNEIYPQFFRDRPARFGYGLSGDGRYILLGAEGLGDVILDRFGIQGDVDGDDCVDDADLLMVLFRFGRRYGPEDVNVDGIVDEQDLLMVLSRFGECVR